MRWLVTHAVTATIVGNDAELAKAAEDYELSTRAINEEGDTAKIETVADEQVI